MLEPEMPVAAVVLDHPELASIFQRYRIDYCCQGDRTITAAAAQRGIDRELLLAELRSAIAERTAPAANDPRAMSTATLVSYIVTKHHDYLRKALPFVRALAAKVARVHGPHEPRLVELEAIVVALADTLEPHLATEEQELFPALIAGRAQGLDDMQVEHATVGALLERMRTTTDDYALAPGACNSYRTLFSELAHLESDVLEHVHLENHVLAPRFAIRS